jgi:hypothetical protein
MMWFERASEPCRFDRRQSMVDIVQQVNVRAELVPQPSEQRRYRLEIAGAVPHSFDERTAFGRLVRIRRADPVRPGDTGNGTLRPNRRIAARQIAADSRDRLSDRLTARVAVDPDGVT